MKRVLFDGWPLARDSGTPAALHLAAALAALEGAVEAVLALPADAPKLAWLPASVERLVLPVKDTLWDRLTWEQRNLPQAARQSGADLLFLSGTTAPLFSPTAQVSSLAGWPLSRLWEPGAARREAGLAGRLRRALGQGGLSRSRAVFWPNDLPGPEGFPNLLPVPPLVHPAFRPASGTFFQASWPGLELPETYILYHGPLDRRSIERLLETWSWAVGPVGTYYPLVVCGAAGAARELFEAMLTETGLGESVILLPGDVSNPAHYASLYQGCTALLHPGPVSPWGDPVRHAMACAKPVAAASGPRNGALVGPAGYLIPADDPRQMGAALITLCVENELADELGQQAAQRAQTWTLETYRDAVLKIL